MIVLQKQVQCTSNCPYLTNCNVLCDLGDDLANYLLFNTDLKLRPIYISADQYKDKDCVQGSLNSIIGVAVGGRLATAGPIIWQQRKLPYGTAQF